MTFPHNSLRAFLHHAKRCLTHSVSSNQKVNVVIGNESADLDSLTSSLLYAYIRSISPPPNAFAPLYIPLLNIPSSGLRLRPEFTAVCEHVNISPSHLITLDDFPSQSKPLENIRWILVDHNKLQGELGSKYATGVQGVIDHHEEENAVRQDTDPEPRIIEKCSSCTSLVVRYCVQSWDSISSSSVSSGAAHGQGEAAINDTAVTQAWDAQIAKMALASILIDSANLTAPSKVEAVDSAMVDYLERKINMSAKHAKSWDRDAYYSKIDTAKRDIDSLTVGEILWKDYKQWTEHGLHLGISSMVKPLDYLARKANDDSHEASVEENLAKFMQESNLSIFAIMTTSKSVEANFRKELLLQARDDGLKAVEEFVRQAMSALQLEEMEVEGMHAQTSLELNGVWRKIWIQKDVSKSRKQVAPFLREAMGAD